MIRLQLGIQNKDLQWGMVVKDPGPQLAVEYIERVNRELENEPPAIGREAVRALFSGVPGCMSDDIIAERGER